MSKGLLVICNILITFVCLYYLNKKTLMFKKYNKYRLYSKYYTKISYFIVFSVCLGLLTRYIVFYADTTGWSSGYMRFLPLLIGFLLFIFVPICGIYYIVKMVIEINNITKGKFDYSEKNKLIWLSDIIYILVLILPYIKLNKIF